MKKRAFTLVELLVVIAIIALLMALLMPALRLAHDQAAGLICVNNLKQLSMAWFTYTVDNDGELMGGHRFRGNAFNNKNSFPDGFWINPPHDKNLNYTGDPIPSNYEDKLTGIKNGTIYPYVKTVDVFHCPFDARIDIPEQRAHDSYSVAGGMNGEPAYSGSNGKTRPDLVAEVYDEIRHPAKKYVFVEETDDRGWNMGSWIMNYNNGTWIDPLAGWHNERSTLGFADGHAEKHRWQDDRTIEMNEKQLFGQNHPGSPDMLYMFQGYVSGKNK
ncbi:MAG: type II secretion system protein [Planctomycetota bacterium]|jgi:prepilin-type N-terminal cleavage/methylation domain-containing protein/prepilin-type processing-associated H-X9-DG protein